MREYALQFCEITLPCLCLSGNFIQQVQKTNHLVKLRRCTTVLILQFGFPKQHQCISASAALVHKHHQCIIIGKHICSYISIRRIVLVGFKIHGGSSTKNWNGDYEYSFFPKMLMYYKILWYVVNCSTLHFCLFFFSFRSNLEDCPTQLTLIFIFWYLYLSVE